MIAALGLAGCADRIHHGVVVGNNARGAIHRASCPIRPELAWCQGRHPNAEIRHLLTERLGDAFQRELAAAVEADPRHRDKATHRGHVDDVAATTLAHAGKHGLHHRDRPIHIGCKLTLKIVHRRFLQHAFVTVSGIVHQHFDRTGVPLRFGHGGWNRREVGHVEDQGICTARCERSERVGVALVPHGADHAVAGAQRTLGKRAAEAGTHAGDEEGLGGDGCHGLTPLYWVCIS